MAIQVSPGVNVSEVDLTTSVPAVSTSTGAIAGQFNWGPANSAILTTNEVQLASTFGSPDSNTANVFFSAANFLSYSNALYVVRANCATANNATSNGTPIQINNVNDYVNGQYYASSSGIAGQPFTARYPGALGNSLGVYVWANSSVWTANTSNTADPLYSIGNLFPNAPGTSPYVSQKTGYYPKDQIHIAVVDVLGQFTGVANTVLETFPNMSVLSDCIGPDGSNIYYKNVLLNQSKYIYWTGIPQTTHAGWGNTVSQVTSNSYITNDTALTANVSSGVLSGGTVGTFKAGDLEYAWNLFSDPEKIDVSLLISSDAGSALGAANNIAVQQNIINIATARKDCIVLASPPLANTLGQGGDSSDPSISIPNYVNALSAYSSYAVMDSGWKYQYDKYNDVYRWIPLNGDVAGLCAYTDNVRDPWWSPAGLQRGMIKNVIRVGFNPNKAQRDALYKAGVNPVVTFPGEGTLLFGDKTLQNFPSAFDRINVRRLFIVLEKTISKAARSSLFEFNDTFTRSQFIGLIDPFLRQVKGRRGVYNYKIVCDTTNNTPAVIDGNQFVGDIYIQPARSINFIQLNFVATRTGVSFSSIVGKF